MRDAHTLTLMTLDSARECCFHTRARTGRKAGFLPAAISRHQGDAASPVSLLNVRRVRQHHTKRRSAGEQAPTEFANERSPATPPVAVVRGPAHGCRITACWSFLSNSILISAGVRQPITFSTSS